MKTLFIFLQIHWWIFSPPESVTSEYYEFEESYIVQEVYFNMTPHHFPRFTGTSGILSRHSEYYIIREDELIHAIKNNSLNITQHTKIIDSNPYVYAPDKNGEYKRLSINYSMGLANLFYLDDTGVYKIGGKYYVLRHIKYGYLSNIKLMHMNDDEELEEYDNNHVRLFLFIIELLPSSPEIRKHIWKHKYELFDFWQGNINKQ